MEILTSVRRLYIRFKSLVNDSVYSFGRAALLLLVEVQKHTVPVRERGRIRVNIIYTVYILLYALKECYNIYHFSDMYNSRGMWLLTSRCLHFSSMILNFVSYYHKEYLNYQVYTSIQDKQCPSSNLSSIFRIRHSHLQINIYKGKILRNFPFLLIVRFHVSFRFSGCFNKH